MKNFSAVILAAGAGTRMKSSTPKVLHELSGKALIRWVIDSVSKLKPDNIVLILGHKSQIIEQSLAPLPLKIAYQKEQLGSAHALMQAKSLFDGYKGSLLVISGDVPLIKSSTIKSLLNRNDKDKNSITVLTAIAQNPFGYGRIVKNGGEIDKIVEEKDADAVQKQIKEINSGIYCFDNCVWDALSKVKPNNVKKEYYITDTVAILKDMGKRAGFLTIEDEFEVKGINNRKELAEAEKILQKRTADKLLENGVSIKDPSAVYISPDAKIAPDTTIYPGVFIDNNVIIGSNCIISGNTYIKNSKIGSNCIIKYSYIDGARIGDGVKIGPFSHIRPDAVLKNNSAVGNFSEIKKSQISENAKVNHLSYIGDAQIGKDVNIGAGTITCNFDGFKKHKTIVGDKSFIGSNTNLVAPIKIGKGALIAAGSTITEDIPAGNLAIARARQVTKRKKVIL